MNLTTFDRPHVSLNFEILKILSAVFIWMNKIDRHLWIITGFQFIIDNVKYGHDGWTWPRYECNTYVNGYEFIYHWVSAELCPNSFLQIFTLQLSEEKYFHQKQRLNQISIQPMYILTPTEHDEFVCCITWWSNCSLMQSDGVFSKWRKNNPYIKSMVRKNPNVWEN